MRVCASFYPLADRRKAGMWVQQRMERSSWSKATWRRRHNGNIKSTKSLELTARRSRGAAEAEEIDIWPDAERSPLGLHFYSRRLSSEKMRKEGVADVGYGRL